MSKFVGAKSLLACLALMGLAIFGSQNAQGAAIITNAGNGSLRDDAGINFMGGFEFKVGASNIYVSALGVWDDNSDGLLQSHQIGIWLKSSPATPLATVTVPAGGGTLINEFRYVNLPSLLTLTAGQTYTLGAQLPPGGGDFWRDIIGTGSTLAWAPEVGTLAAHWDTSNSFVMPNGAAGADNAYVGPNAIFQTFIPEPSTGASMAMATSVLLLRRIRRRQSSGAMSD